MLKVELSVKSPNNSNTKNNLSLDMEKVLNTTVKVGA